MVQREGVEIAWEILKTVSKSQSVFFSFVCLFEMAGLSDVDADGVLQHRLSTHTECPI